MNAHMFFLLFCILFVFILGGWGGGGGEGWKSKKNVLKLSSIPELTCIFFSYLSITKEFQTLHDTWLLWATKLIYYTDIVKF